MTLFGERLKKIIDENNINIFRLAQKAGIERTIIHKIVSTNRIPDPEYVRKLAKALPVSPFERDKLLEAYNISKDGEFLYNQRIQVHQLLERMSAVQSSPVSDASADNRRRRLRRRTAQVETVSGTLSVNNLMDDIISRELKADDPCVRFIMPHGYTFFYDTLILKHLKNPDLRAECMFEFFKDKDIKREKRNANLDVISVLAPFIMHSGSFAAYYTYTARPEGYASASPMPYFIATSAEVATLTPDLQTAIVLDSPAAASCYGEIFDDMKENGKPLIGSVMSIGESVAFYHENLGRGDGIAGIGSHPCITNYYNRAVLEKHIPEDLPGREQIIEMSLLICEGIQTLSKERPSPSYFTTGGLELFAERGIIQTIVERFFSPYEPAERADVIKKMIRDTKSNAVIYRVIDTSKIKMPERFFIDVFSGSHINLVVGSEGGDINTVNIFEDSIVEAFLDFLTIASETDLLYSKKDTLKTLNNALERAKSLM